MTDTTRGDLAIAPYEVRIDVRSASLNRVDLMGNPDVGMVRKGLDAAGEVVEIGAAVAGLEVGDRVMALVFGEVGDEVVVDARMVAPIPQSWSYAEGAAAILGLATEYHALATAGRMRRGESVLIHAASSGVGLQGVQMAALLGASPIIATTRRSEAIQLLTSLGADHVIVVEEASFASDVRELTGEVGVDVVVDHVGGPYLAESLAACALGARLVSVGRMGGASGNLDMEALAFNRVEIIGVTFRTRSFGETASIVAALTALLMDAGSAEALRPTVGIRLPWADIRAAHDSMREGRQMGKIILERPRA